MANEDLTKSTGQRDFLSELMQLEKAILDKEAVGQPGYYGLPDLLFPRGFSAGVFNPERSLVVKGDSHYNVSEGFVREQLKTEETEEEYQCRQTEALNDLISNSMFIVKDGRKIFVQTIPILLQWVADVFFRRVSKTITWKPRGGGGSLTAAVLIWLLAVYRKRSTVDIAGSADQSKIVYEYVAQFWSCFPGIKEGIVDGDPLTSITRLTTGVEVKCIVPGTLIYTDKGLLPIEQVKLEDKVLDGNGEFRTVTLVSSRDHDGDVIRIVPTGGMPVTTTPDHLIKSYSMSTQDRNRLRASSWDAWAHSMPEPVWKEAQELRVGDHLYSPVWRDKLSEKFPLVFQNDTGDIRVDRHLTTVDMTPDFYRFMGYWLADGSASGTHVDITFHESEVAYIDDVSALASSVFNRSVTCIRKDNKVIVHFSHKSLACWLKSNCSKSSGKQLPTRIFNCADDDDLLQLLVGALRGDGCATQSLGSNTTEGFPVQKREVSYTTISPHIAQMIMLSSQRLGLCPSIHRYDRKTCKIRGIVYDRKPQFIIRYSGSDCDLLAPLCSFRGMENRRKGVRKTSARNAEWVSRPVRKMETKYYEGVVYDLTVDGSPSFSSPYILFHNCIPATDKQARGKHYATVFIDECCQSDPRVEKAMKAAVQGALSESDPVICLFSTFHLPQGLFQEFWDGYNENGFKRYAWNCIDTMQPCSRGLETATTVDPTAKEFCKQCYLTDKKIIKDISGENEIETWTGCCGQARNSSGWAPFENISEAKKTNTGTTIFECEYLCMRPNYSSCVYPTELVEESLTDPLVIDPSSDTIAVGIDWGIQSAGSLAITLMARKPDHIYLAEALFTDHTLVSEIADWLNDWRARFGDFPVLADSSHPFNNAQLEKAGFDVRPVKFGTFKKIGVENLSKYFVFRRIRINRELTTMIEQLKSYRRSETTGNPVKKNDHGPDSLMCVTLNFAFQDEFGPDIAKAAALVEQTRMLESENTQGRDKFDRSAIDASAPKMYVPAFVTPESMLSQSAERNVLIF